MYSVLFSVIMPTFNRAERLLVALQSVLNQTYPNFEIIVVDDGGNDNTSTLLEELNDNRIKYFWKENEERSIARNFGIDKSVGDYICFLDSDDYWAINNLATAYAHLKNTQPPIFHASYQYVYEDGTEAEVLVNKVSLDEIFKDNYLHLNAVCIRRDVLNEIRFVPSKDAILSEDYFLWLKLAASYDFICSNSITASVVEHEARSLNNVNPDKAAKSFEIIIEHLEEVSVFQTPRYREAYRKYKASRYLLLALFYSLHNKNKMALHYLFKTASFHPSFLFSRRFAAVIKKLIIK